MEGTSLLFSLFTLVLLALLFVQRFSNNKTINFYVSYLFYNLSMGATCIVTLPFAVIRARNVDNLLWASQIFYVFVQPVVKIHWTVKNVHVIEKDQSAVVVCNHQSMFDVMGMGYIWRNMKRCTAIAKKEALLYPLFGITAWFWGLIFIDRKNPKKAVKVLQKAIDLVIAKKVKLWFYVEGTRGDGIAMKPFKKGAFMTAIQMQKPIIPVVMSPYYFIDFKNKTFEKDGQMTISILEEIPTTGLTENDVDDLMEKTYKLMVAEFNKLSAAVKVR